MSPSEDLAHAKRMLAAAEAEGLAVARLLYRRRIQVIIDADPDLDPDRWLVVLPHPGEYLARFSA